MADRDGALLSYRDVSELMGISQGTLRNYRRRGYMPPPDVMVADDRPRWREATILEWKRQRTVGANTQRDSA